jgi:hypothetical protein
MVTDFVRGGAHHAPVVPKGEIAADQAGIGALRYHELSKQRVSSAQKKVKTVSIAGFHGKNNSLGWNHPFSSEHRLYTPPYVQRCVI